MAWLDFEFLTCSLPLGDCIVSSDTMKASSQRGGSQLRSSSGPLGTVSEVHGVFSNRDLPSTSGGGNRRQQE